MPRSRDLWVGVKNNHTFEIFEAISSIELYSLYNFYGPTMTIKDRL